MKQCLRKAPASPGGTDRARVPGCVQMPGTRESYSSCPGTPSSDVSHGHLRFAPTWNSDFPGVPRFRSEHRLGRSPLTEACGPRAKKGLGPLRAVTATEEPLHFWIAAHARHPAALSQQSWLASLWSGREGRALAATGDLETVPATACGGAFGHAAGRKCSQRAVRGGQAAVCLPVK